MSGENVATDPRRGERAYIASGGAIDDVNSEYLDVLLDLSGDDFMGAQTIDTATAEP